MDGISASESQFKSKSKRLLLISRNKKAGYAGSFTETLTILLIKQLQLRFQPEDLFGLQLLRKSLSDLQQEYDDQYR